MGDLRGLKREVERQSPVWAWFVSCRAGGSEVPGPSYSYTYIDTKVTATLYTLGVCIIACVI